MSSTPLLESARDGTAHRRKRSNNPMMSLFPGGSSIGAATTAYEGICFMLNAEDREEQDKLTENWRDHKLEELNFVGTVGALLASCLSSTSAWPDVLNNGHDKPWSVRAFNFCGLVFALFSVMIAGLQSMRLHRLSAHRDGLQLIRRGLSGKESSGRSRPTTLQVYAWEASLAFLVMSVACLVIGVTVLVWVSTAYGPDKPQRHGWWDENSKMAVTFTSVLGFALIILFASQSAIRGNHDD